jgi:hypothetical protein
LGQDLTFVQRLEIFNGELLILEVVVELGLVKEGVVALEVVEVAFAVTAVVVVLAPGVPVA